MKVDIRINGERLLADFPTDQDATEFLVAFANLAARKGAVIAMKAMGEAVLLLNGAPPIPDNLQSVWSPRL